MNLTDFYFLCAFAVILVIYYIVPGKCQWGVILVSSIAFYLLNGHPLLILYPVLSVTVTYISALCIRKSGSAAGKKKAFIAGIAFLLCVMILVKALKYFFESGLINLSSDDGFGIAELLVPLGLSYYTFSLIGYIADVYNGITEHNISFLKLLAFGMYFPALISGPIMQFRTLAEDFYSEHKFEPENIAFGAQRMLWGFFKKLVIAQRLAPAVSVMFNDFNTFCGRDVAWAVLLFTIQLYTDFSGLMDIVLGISQCLGITLPENFNTPFFSQSVSEYWRRWHITLGAWFREYVFYPLLRSKPHTAFSKLLKDKAGKKAGKQLSTFAAMFVLWLTVGLWHGGKLTFVIGSGLLQWIYIMLEESLKSPFDSLWKKIHINSNTAILKFIRIIRTFILINFGNLFFRSASVPAAFNAIRSFITGDGGILGFIFETLENELPGRGIRALSDNTLVNLTYIDMGILAFSILVLFAADLYKYRTGNMIREKIASQNICLRMIIWLVCAIFVILLAVYGPGFSSSEFIYQGF